MILLAEQRNLRHHVEVAAKTTASIASRRGPSREAHDQTWS